MIQGKIGNWSLENQPISRQGRNIHRQRNFVKKPWNVQCPLKRSGFYRIIDCKLPYNYNFGVSQKQKGCFLCVSL